MSSKIYCIAQFRAKEGKEDELFRVLQSLESDTLREDGCLQYVVTRHIPNPFATGKTEYPIVFNEIWQNVRHFEAHVARKAIVHFFERHCLDPNGLVEAYNVTVYTDEPEGYDAPLL
jgi:quinol monooxygenase YgiN